MSTRTAKMIGPRLVLLATAAALAVPAAATAAQWRQLPQSPRSAAGTQVSAVRMPDGSLDVAYPVSDGGNAPTDVVTALISPAGVVTAGPPIATAWAGAGNAALIARGDGVDAFFGGMHSGASDDPNQDLNFASTATPSSAWTVAAGSASATEGVNDDEAYASGISAASLPDGTPFEAWGHTLGVTVHRGIGSAFPNQDFQAAFDGCCGYGPALAVDGVSGQPGVTWYSGATGHTGYYEQAVDASSGAPVGTAALVPGSAVGGHSAAPNAHTVLTGRPAQPGLFTAVAGGYPIQNKVLVWRVGAPKSILVSKGTQSIRNVAISSDPAGRVWATWTRPSANGKQLFAARSNPAGTIFGAPASIKLPPGTVESEALDTSAQAGSLDVLGTFGLTSGKGFVLAATRLQPGLDVQAMSISVKKGRRAVVSVRVLDAGASVPGAVVSTAGSHAATGRTNAAGTVKLKLGKFTHGGKIALKATKAGYATGVGSVRVRVSRQHH